MMNPESPLPYRMDASFELHAHGSWETGGVLEIWHRSQLVDLLSLPPAKWAIVGLLMLAASRFTEASWSAAFMTASQLAKELTKRTSLVVDEEKVTRFVHKLRIILANSKAHAPRCDGMAWAKQVIETHRFLGYRISLPPEKLGLHLLGMDLPEGKPPVNRDRDPSERDDTKPDEPPEMKAEENAPSEPSFFVPSFAKSAFAHRSERRPSQMNHRVEFPLGDGRYLHGMRLPEIVFRDEQFDPLWLLHPEEYHELVMRGKKVRSPCWQQAFGADYHYTGGVNRALPIPALIQPLLDWSRSHVDARLNGVLVNWYDGKLKHKIGPHRDSTKHMAYDAPIVTISFGEQRVFRMRPYKGKGYRDFPVMNRDVIVMPYETNLAWTHEVPHSQKRQGRRISVTIRAFDEGLLESDTH